VKIDRNAARTQKKVEGWLGAKGLNKSVNRTVFSSSPGYIHYLTKNLMPI
jgi:hypothetical protein